MIGTINIMAYYECLNKNNYIYIEDKFTVSLTGSHNLTTSATVCYIDKTTVCLLGDTNLGDANWSTTCNYAWNYSININNKKYIGTCRIPTFEQIHSKCAGYKRSFSYWTSTIYDGYIAWCVSSNGIMFQYGSSNNVGTLPFIEIVL